MAKAGKREISQVSPETCKSLDLAARCYSERKTTEMPGVNSGGWLGKMLIIYQMRLSS